MSDAPTRPGVASVRIIGPAAVVEAAAASLAANYGDLWQPGGGGPSRKSATDVLLYGTLIVPVPAGGAEPPVQAEVTRTRRRLGR